ncbi:uncharacterized protein LOC131678496 [Topomyia yanbarensis]|uniref:uncharacterized protein LOC131678496 n=1 Tax=Topomyia yanbarensis TaxID=2498891 RepID=UPI00273ADC08|nr:uncharacterized protein LOC131678496 [Topomyia yanbarensis]
MEQNIFDVSDDISFPWLPAYAEATEPGQQLAVCSSRMLETIVEETSDDDDGRGQQPTSLEQQGWSQFDQVWSSADSDTGSVIRVDTPSDQDTMSERDFICPPKRRKQDNGVDGEDPAGGNELNSDFGSFRKPKIIEPDGQEVTEYFMRRQTEPRLRFDEIGHDLFTDSDSLSYASLSRSSSLIQFESLERQLQNESVAVASAPLSGSSPSLYSSGLLSGGDGAGSGPLGSENLRISNVGADTLGFYPSSPGKKGNLLTASNLIQQNKLKVSGGAGGIGIGCKQPVLNISDSELYSSSSVSSSGSSSSSSSSGGGSSCNYASDECDLNHENTPSPSESQVTKSSSDEADGLVRCPQRCSERRKSLNQLKTKNSIESLSEDSGYCDHLHFNMNNLRVKSKSLTNFGSAENVNMFMEPVPLDYYEQRHVSFHQENRLSTVCDEDEEEAEQEQCTKEGTVQRNSEESLSNKYERSKPEQRWYTANANTNIHNCTKIDLDTSKHSRTPGSSGEQTPFVVVSKIMPPSPSSSSSSSSSSPVSSRTGSTDSLERHPAAAAAVPIATNLDRHHRTEPKPKNSHRRPSQKDDVEQLSCSRKRPRSQQQSRRRTIISASSPDLFSSDERRGTTLVRIRSRKQSQRRKVSDFLDYGGINFSVSSVPDCLNLCGGGHLADWRQREQSESLDSFELSESAPSSGNYCSWNLQPDSVASKNFDLYDYKEETDQVLVPTVIKSVKTVTFQTVTKPRVDIRASYANLTALDYSDDEDGKPYFLKRNTFRTSSGTRLGGVREMAGPWEAKKIFNEDEEEERIFPVDGDETNVFNSLLDEISAHFDRNLSIINDQAETYEPIAAFLHEQRVTPQVSSFTALVTPPQPPPRRTQIKTNPHHLQGPTTVPAEAKIRTFDQDPTNLVTCYAASLERCTFDPTESTLDLYNNSGAVNKPNDFHINHPMMATTRCAPVVVAKREFVSSTPNLNYYHASCGDGEGGLNAHRNSLKNVSCLEIGGGGELACRSTGILTTASSSKCGLSKGVSFCPIVSEIIWKDTGSELDPDDNASVISNQDFEIDMDDDDFDQDDYDHANLIATQTNTLINANSVETGLCELINKADSLLGYYHRDNDGTDDDHHHHPHEAPTQCQQRVPTPVMFELDQSDVIDLLSRETPPNDHSPREVKKRDNDINASSSVNNAASASKKAKHMQADESELSTKVIVAERGCTMASAIGNGVDASRNLIAVESAAPPQPTLPTGGAEDSQTQPQQQTQQKFVNNNNNLIKNFKNGKAEKKGKTFLSRLSSGFRFSFRGKSKKNKDGVSGSSNGKVGNTVVVSDKQSAPAKVKESGIDKVSADFIYIPLKDPTGQQQQHQPYPPSEVDNSVSGASEVVDNEEYYLRQMNTVGLQDNDNGEDQIDDANMSFASNSTSILNSSRVSGGGSSGPRNHVLSGKPPLPKQPPRVVGVCTKRSTPAAGRYAHASQRASSTPPRTEIDLDESHSSGGFYRQYTNGAGTIYGAEGASGLSPSFSAVSGRCNSSAIRASYQQQPVAGDNNHYFNHIMGSEQKIGLIETNLDTHETVISGKTRSLMELGGPSSQMHQLQVHHGGGGGGGVGDAGVGGGGGGAVGVGDGTSKRLGGVNGIKDRQTTAIANEPGRPHKSMEFLLDKENQRNVLPPENELQKSHETGTNLSEHQLRVQASLQRLNIPDWYKQYSGRDGANVSTLANNSAGPATSGVLRKRNSDIGRWTGLSSKTTSLSSLGSHRSDRSPVMLSPSAHSHHGGQTGFSRWSTSHLNSNQTSPSVSTRGSFTRGGLNSSVVSGYSTASTTAGATAGANSAIRNSFRQPYLGWRSQEKLSQPPRTPAERLASSLLSQQKAKEQQQRNHQKVEPVVTPEIQSSIKEVTSAIVHYVNDQTNRHSRSRSTSPSQRCWLESSFVGTRPLDSPQTPMIESNSSSAAVVLGSGHPQQNQHQTNVSVVAGDHYRYNAGRMNGVGESTLI